MVRHQFTAERQIDAGTLARVWQFYKSNPTVRCCVSVLRACIFSGELVVRDGRGSPVVDRHCRQVLERALDWMLVAGVVPVTTGSIVAPDGGHLRVPVVPGHDFVVLKVHTNPESGYVSYTGMTRSQGMMGSVSNSRRKKGSVRVWDAGKDTPTGEGTLSTDMVSLCEREDLLKEYRKYALVAHAARCNPRVFTQAQRRATGDSNGVNWMQPEEVFVQSEKERLAAADNVLASQANGKGNWQRSQNMWPQTLVGVARAEDFVPEEFPISAERDLVRHIQPEAPTDIGEMEKAARAECLRVFCIPEAVFEAQPRASAAHLQDYVFNCTLRKWQGALQAFIDGALAACNANMPRYDLQCMPCVTHDVLSQLHNDGVLTTASYARISDHSLGLTHTNPQLQKRRTAGTQEQEDESFVKRRKLRTKDEALGVSP